MRAHQPGSTPIDIPETVPNPAYTPAPAPAPERPPTKVPEQVPEKVIAPDDSLAAKYGTLLVCLKKFTPSLRPALNRKIDVGARNGVSPMPLRANFSQPNKESCARGLNARRGLLAGEKGNGNAHATITLWDARHKCPGRGPAIFGESDAWGVASKN
jgi:hypothetical protein